MTGKKPGIKNGVTSKATGSAKRKAVKKAQGRRQTTQPEKERSGLGFPVVGIGASAGGLEAIEQLFRNMPNDTGMAFVLVQHLDPNHKSILSELVARFTQMPVANARHGQRIQPNHVYVIPPKHDLALLNGVLQLMEPSGPRQLRLSVDYFFRSLAQDQGANVFGIVLSGAGSDGTLGLRAIKGEGGVVLVQEPETAAYDSMPLSAHATGLVDMVLPPAKMGDWLKARGWKLAMPERGEQVANALREGNEVDRLFVLIRNRTGYDFSQYKGGTIGRRIDRRMLVNQVDSLEEYISLLQASPAEVDRLWKEFLIRVTQFFRNPNAFTVLEREVIPALLSDRPSQEPLRIWVPACSTGEEAYSIAMLVQSQLERQGRSHGVQIFATDIDEEALQVARAGIYPNTIAADVPSPYLRRYLVKHTNGFQVVKAVRSLLVFSRHDITRDPPFSRMDLVSCRNLLIYMRPELQYGVIDSLTYALKREAYLFLGQSEGVGKFAELYETLDARAKLYRRSGGVHRDPALANRPPRRLSMSPSATHPASRDAPDIQQLTRTALLAEFTPACVVVDANKQVVYIHGHTGMFLEPAMGRASMDVLRMSREGLRAELNGAIRSVLNNERIDRIDGIRVSAPGGLRLVNLRVQKRPGTGQEATYVMVLFEDAGPVTPPTGQPYPEHVADPSDAARTAWLEQELADTRETLQNANEELECSNEELQSTVEELQSSNEELMTSQEELSSINEELHTVNVELEDKVRMLESTTNDLSNLLVSTELATIFLDLDLKVRRFTPAAAKVVSLIEGDVGRPLADLAHKLDYQGLITDAEAVLDNVMPKVLDVRSRDGVWYSLRITLYRTSANAIDGVVLTFIDLSERILAEKRFLGLLELAPDATVITDLSGQIVQANERAVRLFGYTRDAIMGRSIEALLPERLRDRHGDQRRAYQRHPRTRPMGQAGQHLLARRKDGSEFPADIAIGPIQTDEGKLFVASVRDVSAQHRISMSLQRSKRMFDALAAWRRECFLDEVDVAEALGQLGRRVVEELGYGQCWIGLVDKDDEELRLVEVAQFGFPRDDAGVELAWVAPGADLEPLVLRDVQRTGPRRLRERAGAWGCNAVLVAPMAVGRRCIGLFVVCAAEVDAFAPDEMWMWHTLTSSLGSMLVALPDGDAGTGKVRGL